MNSRHSVRAYDSKPVEEEKLTKIFQASILAPSAGNLQAYEVHICRAKAVKKRLAVAALNQTFLEEASVCLVFCADPNRSSRKYGRRGVELYCVQDATIAATYAVLAAVNLGLATVWVGAFDEEQVKKILEIQRVKPVAIVAIGHPAEIPGPTPRRPINDIFLENRDLEAR